MKEMKKEAINLELPKAVMENIKKTYSTREKLGKGKKKMRAYYDMMQGDIHICYTVMTEFTRIYEEVTVYGPTGDILEVMQRNIQDATLFQPWAGERYMVTFTQR